MSLLSSIGSSKRPIESQSIESAEQHRDKRQRLRSNDSSNNHSTPNTDQQADDTNRELTKAVNDIGSVLFTGGSMDNTQLLERRAATIVNPSCEKADNLKTQAGSLKGADKWELLVEAQNVLEKAIEHDPNNTYVLSVLGDVLRLRMEDCPNYRSREIFKRVLQRDPENAFALGILGKVLAQQVYALSEEAKEAKLLEAQNVLNEALSLDPNNLSYTQAQITLDDVEGIIENLRIFIDNKNYFLNKLSVLLKRRECHLDAEELQNLAEAQKKFEEVIRLNSSDPYALSVLGDILRAQACSLSGEDKERQLNEAEEKLRKAKELHLHPPSGGDYSSYDQFLGDSWNDQHEVYISTVLENILRMQADLMEGEAKEAQLAKASQEGADKQKKLEFWEQYYKNHEDPNNTYVLRMLGDILRMQADLMEGEAREAKMSEARERLNTAHGIEPNNPCILRSLGDVLRMQACSLKGAAKENKLVELWGVLKTQTNSLIIELDLLQKETRAAEAKEVEVRRTFDEAVSISPTLWIINNCRDGYFLSLEI